MVWTIMSGTPTKVTYDHKMAVFCTTTRFLSLGKLNILAPHMTALESGPLIGASPSGAWGRRILSQSGWSGVGAEPSTRVDVFVNMGIIRWLREMLDVMCSDICDRNQDLWLWYVMPTKWTWYCTVNPRGLSALSGEQFPPTLCGRVGEAAPLLLNTTCNCNQELSLLLFLSSLGSLHTVSQQLATGWW